MFLQIIKVGPHTQSTFIKYVHTWTTLEMIANTLTNEGTLKEKPTTTNLV